MTSLSLLANGSHGSNATNGAHGSHGRDRGRHGQSGGSSYPGGYPGQGGGSIVVHLSTLQDIKESNDTNTLQTVKAHFRKTVNSGGQDFVEEDQLLTQDDSIALSAIGGNGGNGANGGNGGDGTKGRAGFGDQNGGDGGDGGDAGSGSSGGCGGSGGKIEVHVDDNDSYLVMTVAHADNPIGLVRGGLGGKAGTHGRPGTGGKGGRGGSGSTSRDIDGNTTYSSGGHRGKQGRSGREATTSLTAGRRGRDGTFSLCVKDWTGVHSYSQRFDLLLDGWTASSHEEISDTMHVFQFGDTVKITGITSKNVGGMKSPCQPVDLKIQGRTSILPLEARNSALLIDRIEKESTGSADGHLAFSIPTPKLKYLGADFEPYHEHTQLHLEAHQLGPHQFSRRYMNFDNRGKPVHFRFPVENTQGFKGLPSIRAGCATRVNFALKNISTTDLGIKSTGGRKVFVQFYLNSSDEFDIPNEDFVLTIEGVECKSLSQNTGANSVQGNLFPIELLESQRTAELTGSLWISPQVAPYSRLGIQAEILLDCLSSDEEEPLLTLIQRRQLVVATEPTYHSSKRNRAVLVTSDSTTKEEFNAWKNLLSKRLGLAIEFFSVSIYGSLCPDHILSSGVTVAEAFANKLVVVLDRAFNPLHDDVSSLNPSGMLPNGCMSQASGFLDTTRWLLVGSTKEAVEKTMDAHYTAPPTDYREFQSEKEFYAVQLERLSWERSSGVVKDIEIREDFIVYKEVKRMHPNDLMEKGGRKLKQKASEIASWLRKRDPLRQYIVEWRVQPKVTKEGSTFGSVVVRRGYCRTTNSVYVVPNVLDNEHRILGGCTVLATLQALPHSTFVETFCKAVHAGDSSLVEICLDAVVQAFLWDVANFVDGQLQITDKFDQAFPSLQMLSRNEELVALVGGGTPDGTVALSKLVARLECVAESKDLRPWWCPWSSKFAIQQRLKVDVEGLRSEWRSVVKPDTVEKEKKDIIDQVEVRRDYRFRDGVYRLVEMGDSAYKKKARALAPMKQVMSKQACNAMREAMAVQQIKSADLLSSIQETRKLNEDSAVEREVEVNTGA